MPTYSYACTDCGHRFDAVQAFTDDSLTECPECRGTLRKVYGSVGVVFKGSGFYRTDSRSGSSTSTVSAHDSGESKSGSSDGAAAKSGDSGSSSKNAASNGSASSSASSSGSSSGSSTQAKAAPAKAAS